MVGYGANRGIVPIACDEIFKRIEANTDPTRGIFFNGIINISRLWGVNQYDRNL